MTNNGHCIACGRTLSNEHLGDPLYDQNVCHCPIHGPVATIEAYSYTQDYMLAVRTPQDEKPGKH